MILNLTEILYLFLATSCASEANFYSSLRVRGGGSGLDAGPENPDRPLSVPPTTGSFGTQGVEQASAQTDLSKVRKVFPVSQKHEGKVTLNIPDRSLTTSVTLEHIHSPELDLYTQSARPSVMDTLIQGNPGVENIENFTPAELGMVDIQIVIDDSSSMGNEQNKLQTKLPDLLSHIATRQWQINFVDTTSVDYRPQSPCSRGFIKKGDSDAVTRFQRAVNAGTDGSQVEEGFRRAVDGLRCSVPAPWVRPGSQVFVLIVSDEDNCQDNTRCGFPYNTEDYLLNYLTETLKRPLKTHSRVYGLIGKPQNGGGKGDGVYKLGLTYLKAIEKSGGYAGEISDPDYSTTFQVISKDIASILQSKFALKFIPDPQSVQVLVNGIAVPTRSPAGAVNWDFEQGVPNVIVFKSLVFSDRDTVTVKYTTGKRGIYGKSFALSQRPHQALSPEFTVRVTGSVMKENTDFRYDPASNSVLFTDPPPIGAEVRIDYKRAVDLPKKFKLSKNAVADKLIQVSINGTPVPILTYDPGSLEVTLVDSPPDSAKVEIKYPSLKGFKTEYPLVLLGNEQKNIRIFYERNMQELAHAKIENNHLIVSELGFKVGEKVVIKYDTEQSGVHKVVLPQKPLAESLVIKVSDGICHANLSQASLEMSLKCADSGPKLVEIVYSYQSEPVSSFEIAEVRSPEIGQWTVFIDDVKTADYTRKGNVIALNQAPPPSAVVAIEFSTNL